MRSRCRALIGLLGLSSAAILCASGAQLNSIPRSVRQQTDLRLITPVLAPPPTPPTGGGSVITGECTGDPDCDDLDDCTIDQCIDSVCVTVRINEPPFV